MRKLASWDRRDRECMEEEEGREGEGRGEDGEGDGWMSFSGLRRCRRGSLPLKATRLWIIRSDQIFTWSTPETWDGVGRLDGALETVAIHPSAAAAAAVVVVPTKAGATMALLVEQERRKRSVRKEPLGKVSR